MEQNAAVSACSMAAKLQAMITAAKCAAACKGLLLGVLLSSLTAVMWSRSTALLEIAHPGAQAEGSGSQLSSKQQAYSHTVTAMA